MLRPFGVSSEKLSVLQMVQVDNKGIIDGLWRGDMICIGPKANDADLWIWIGKQMSLFGKYRWRQ